MKPVYAIVLDAFEPLYPDQWPVSQTASTLKGAKAVKYYTGMPGLWPRSQWVGEEKAKSMLHYAGNPNAPPAPATIYRLTRKTA